MHLISRRKKKATNNRKTFEKRGKTLKNVEKRAKNGKSAENCRETRKNAEKQTNAKIIERVVNNEAK